MRSLCRIGFAILCAAAFSGCDGVVQFSGTVVDPSGKPIAGVDVSIKPAPESDYEIEREVEPTDSNGRFGYGMTCSPYLRNPVFIFDFHKDGYDSKSLRIDSDHDDNINVVLPPAKPK